MQNQQVGLCIILRNIQNVCDLLIEILADELDARLSPYMADRSVRLWNYRCWNTNWKTVPAVLSLKIISCDRSARAEFQTIPVAKCHFDHGFG